MEPLSTPDITLMQKLVGAVSALIVAGLAVAQAFGADFTVEQSSAILGLWTALGGILVIADAVIRNGRARAFTNYPKGVVETSAPPPEEPGA